MTRAWSGRRRAATATGALSGTRARLSVEPAYLVHAAAAVPWTGADARGPMFLDPDRMRPLLYSKLESSARLGRPGAGARVRGGAAPTGANRQQYQERSRLSHGGGAGPVVGAHERYDRFSMDRVVRIPAIIARVDEGDGAAPPPGMLLAWVAAMRTTSPRSRRRTWALARRR